MVYCKIKLTKIHFRKVTFLTLTRIFSTFSPPCTPQTGPPYMNVCMLVRYIKDQRSIIHPKKTLSSTFEMDLTPKGGGKKYV